MKWLILGSTGMLGRALVQEAAVQDIDTIRWGRDRFDLSRPRHFWPTIPPGVTHLINAAAYTDVDGAEDHEAEATRVNGLAVAALSNLCGGAGLRLVHFSTDYVFDGAGTRPYRTDDPRAPINAYGRSKVVGEEALQAGPARFLCLRTSWLYAPWGRNFVLTMRRLMEQRDALRVVDDQRGRPTSAIHLADMTRRLIAADATGFHHACDGGECTWHGLARHIADRVGWNGRLEPCDTDAFPRPAPRPAYSVLDLSGTERLIGPRSPWRRHVDEVLDAPPVSDAGPPVITFRAKPRADGVTKP